MSVGWISGHSSQTKIMKIYGAHIPQFHLTPPEFTALITSLIITSLIKGQASGEIIPLMVVQKRP